jgi:hypothetical protein|eukprot:COSAG06_NODE_3645_length_5078_cov_4.545089_6_plen_67_part_00
MLATLKILSEGNLHGCHRRTTAFRAAVAAILRVFQSSGDTAGSVVTEHSYTGVVARSKAGMHPLHT